LKGYQDDGCLCAKTGKRKILTTEIQEFVEIPSKINSFLCYHFVILQNDRSKVLIPIFVGYKYPSLSTLLLLK